MKTAYNKAHRPDTAKEDVQEYTEIQKINFLSIFVNKLNNLANTEATFDIESDSTQTERLKILCKDLESKRFSITEGFLGEGDYYVFPATNEKGEVIHSYLRKSQVSIINSDGDDIKEAVGIIDWYVDKDNKTYFLLRHHKLESNGNLTVSYSTVTDDFKPTTLDEWEYLNEQAYTFKGANHIGFGRYKSPVSSRGLSPVYGVPLNFGCDDIEKKIFNDLTLIEKEFKNGESKIFADPLILQEKDNEYDIPENIFPIYPRAGQPGPNIDIFSPALRYSEHYSKLVSDMALYEKQIGTSKGILTDNETTETATATAVKRANADTLSLLNKIHTAIDNGNEMTLQADSVFLNISPDLWSYKSDYFDPFEDPAEQWKRLIEAKDNGAAEDVDLARWIFPNLTEEELDKKLSNIKSESQNDTDSTLEKILGGA